MNSIFAKSALLCLLVSLGTTRARGVDDCLTSGQKQALESNARSMDNLYLKGSKKVRFLGPASRVLASIKTLESEQEFTEQVEFEIRLKGNLLYEKLRYPVGKYRSGNGFDERSFDGSRYVGGSCDPSTPSNPGTLIIRSPSVLDAQQNDRASEEKIFEFWYLLEAGFAAPLIGAELGESVQSLLLKRASEGRIESCREVERGGKRLIEVTVEYPEPWGSRRTTPIEIDPFLKGLRGKSKGLQIGIEKQRRQLANRSRFSRFVLDPALNYAVVEKWEMRARDGEVMFHTVNSDFARIDAEAPWLPKSCEVTSHSYGTNPLFISAKPLYATRITIDAMERKPSNIEDFRVWFDLPGITVADYTSPGATFKEPRTFNVPTTGTDLERLSGGSSRKRILIVVILNVVIAVAVVAAFYARRRKAGIK